MELYNTDSMGQRKLKKTIFTLNVDGYAPEITEFTYPLIKRYADKIGADFYIIKERKFPKFPPVYEKMQIYDLGRQMKNDWNIYIDSDALVHPDMFDVTEFISKDTVCHNGNDMANIRWRYDDYFRRDGRHIGSCNWLTIASDWCLDLWHPLDIPYEEALKNIFPIQNELNTVITREHLIDDYMLSRNIARFGLKFKRVDKIIEERGGGNYFWHQYTINIKEKVELMKNILATWEITDYKDPKIEGWTDLPELSWLYLMAKDMNCVAEIGAWKGRDAHALASACKGKVYAIDNFQANPSDGYATVPERFLIPKVGDSPAVDVEKEFIKNTKDFSNVDLIRLDSITASEKFEDNSIDMVWIDASHDYDSVVKDVKAWLPKCKKLFCGHDYDHETVKKALFDCLLKPAIGPGRIWYVIKG